MVFRGNFPAKVDAQGRLKIPTAHRKILEDAYGSDLFVTSVTGQNALIYPLSEWEQIEAKLLEPPKMRPAKVKFLRNTAYFGQVSSIDKQGRVLIQPHLREAASIDGDVAVIGYLNYLEVWNQTRFLELLESDPYTDEDASALADLGI
ncbi:MAG TPA: division/cell wall cluster transcriptional repressor MraZ [Acidobacteriota bacterium]|nr:division/cell wall cluster transcriptional repressor MraZ [Acidobacteriota bacterium]